MKLFLISILILGSQFLTSCATKPADTTIPPVVVKPAERIALYWENTSSPHPERKPWSDELTAEVRKNLPTFSKAKDIKEICPKFDSLNEDQKVKGISEFFVALAYFESSFNPKSNSVDVGNKTNKCSWSIGLFQLSCTDSAAKAVGATTFESLQDPIMNIRAVSETFKRQINNCGEFILPNTSKCRYFATILEGNKYSKIPEIKARVLKYAPSCK